MRFYRTKPARIVWTILLLAFASFLLGNNNRPKKGLSILLPFEFAELALISASQVLLILGCIGVSMLPALWIFELARRLKKGKAGRWAAAAGSYAIYMGILVGMIIGMNHRFQEAERTRREDANAMLEMQRDIERDDQIMRPVLQRMKREAEAGNRDRFRLAFREAVLLVPSLRISFLETNTWSEVDPETSVKTLYKRETGRDEDSTMFVLLTPAEANALRAAESERVTQQYRMLAPDPVQDVRQTLWDRISPHARRMDAEFRVGNRLGFYVEYHQAVRQAKELGAFDPDRYVQEVYFKITGRSAVEFLK